MNTCSSLLAVAGPAAADHAAELRPVLVGPGPAGEGHGGAVDAQQAAAAADELEQALPQLRVGEQVAHGVVEEDGVELLAGSPRSKTAGSRLTTVSNAPVFSPIRVKARLA